ncbi:MAG: hypothetical protein ISN64_03700 [Rickettsia sp.]|nr:hypothetical protein [Rickettsia sp.]
MPNIETDHNLMHLEFAKYFGKAILIETNSVDLTISAIEDSLKINILKNFKGNLFDHPDFLEISTSSKYINLNQIRQVSLFLQKTSIYSGYKIVLIKNAESLNIFASNAFLKQIEELSPNNLVILITESFYKIIYTIYNRCLRLRNFYTKLKIVFNKEFSFFFLKSTTFTDKIIFIEKITEKSNWTLWKNFMFHTELLIKNMLYKSLFDYSLSQIEEKIFFQFKNRSSYSFFLLLEKIYSLVNNSYRYDLDQRTSVLIVLNEFL